MTMHTHGEAFQLYSAVLVVTLVIGLSVVLLMPYV